MTIAVDPMWEVKAWVTAPGDFPERSLETFRVHAVNARDALTEAQRHFLAAHVPPLTTVRLERIHPPAEEAP